MVVNRVGSRLGIPQLLLGSGSGAVTVESTGVSDARKVDEMLRRNFSGAVAALAFGVGVDALDDDASLLWPVALSVARKAETARATDLTVQLLLAMTHQALHLRRPQEALGFVQLGHSVAAGRSQPLEAATASTLAGYQAMCHGAQGDAGACDRTIGQAIEHFAEADPAKAAPWVAYVSAAELAAQQGHAQYTLALATTDVTYAARAVPLLQQAVHGFGPAYARSRAVNLAGLAGARALTGNLDAAVYTGHQAVEEITALASPRAYDRLRTLDTVLRPHSTDATVSEVRSRIHQALAAA